MLFRSYIFKWLIIIQGCLLIINAHFSSIMMCGVGVLIHMWASAMQSLSATSQRALLLYMHTLYRAYLRDYLYHRYNFVPCLDSRSVGQPTIHSIKKSKYIYLFLLLHFSIMAFGSQYTLNIKSYCFTLNCWIIATDK